jgi:hypothetical protein
VRDVGPAENSAAKRNGSASRNAFTSISAADHVCKTAAKHLTTNGGGDGDSALRDTTGRAALIVSISAGAAPHVSAVTYRTMLMP